MPEATMKSTVCWMNALPTLLVVSGLRWQCAMWMVLGNYVVRVARTLRVANTTPKGCLHFWFLWKGISNHQIALGSLSGVWSSFGCGYIISLKQENTKRLFRNVVAFPTEAQNGILRLGGVAFHQGKHSQIYIYTWCIYVYMWVCVIVYRCICMCMCIYI